MTTAPEIDKVKNADEAVDEKTFCYRHPTVETALRCNKCGNYICPRCAVRTPVGYRCPACVRQQQDTFFNASIKDYVIAAVVAFALAVPIGFVLAKIYFLAIIMGLPAGGLISEAVHRATGRRRGRYTWLVVGIAAGLGVIAGNYQEVALVIEALGDGTGTSAASLLIGPGIALVLCAGAAGARFRFGKR